MLQDSRLVSSTDISWIIWLLFNNHSNNHWSEGQNLVLLNILIVKPKQHGEIGIQEWRCYKTPESILVSINRAMSVVGEQPSYFLGRTQMCRSENLKSLMKFLVYSLKDRTLRCTPPLGSAWPPTPHRNMRSCADTQTHTKTHIPASPLAIHERRLIRL